MSFIIVSSDNQLYKIAENEQDKNNLNCSYPPYKAVTISDSDFLKIKTNLATASYVNDSVSVIDITPDQERLGLEIQEYINNLKFYLENVKNLLQNFIKNNDSNHVFYTRIINYFNYLNGLDLSTIQYPINNNWENYCQQNSIDYLHPLQIP